MYEETGLCVFAFSARKDEKSREVATRKQGEHDEKTAEKRWNDQKKEKKIEER